MPAGYWYCTQCQKDIAEHNLRDVTYDSELVDYLRVGRLPQDDAAR